MMKMIRRKSPPPGRAELKTGADAKANPAELEQLRVPPIIFME
jgi:hypothetical protein